MQLKLDFSPKPSIDSGKKTERITITCSSDFKEFLDLFCRLSKTNISELGFRYLLEGMRNDLAAMFIAQPHLDKSLREVLQKFF